MGGNGVRLLSLSRFGYVTHSLSMVCIIDLIEVVTVLLLGIAF